MLTLTEIFAILIIHWIADFVLQTDKQTKGKSKNWSDLLMHTWNYSMVWWIIGVILIIFNLKYPFFTYERYSLLLFVLITFIAHTITDYFTSRLNKKLAPEEFTIMLISDIVKKAEPFVHFPKGRNYYKLMMGIGFDQLLHYAQLFLTYYYLTK
jgi:hypothetical protein